MGDPPSGAGTWVRLMPCASQGSETQDLSSLLEPEGSLQALPGLWQTGAPKPVMPAQNTRPGAGDLDMVGGDDDPYVMCL